jgi:peptide deformylase
MATRKIVTIGDEKLRKHSKPVTKFNLRLRILLKDMAETMYRNDGAGLAAPQVGILKRVVVVDVGDRLYELVNPEIVSREGEQTGPEGCLSVPGRVGSVQRPMKVVVKAQNAKGEPFEVTGEGFLARAFCHEIDHLDGVLYVDIMEHEIFPEEEPEEDDDKIFKKKEPAEAEAEAAAEAGAANEGEARL